MQMSLTASKNVTNIYQRRGIDLPSTFKQECHDKGVWGSDFCSVPKSKCNTITRNKSVCSNDRRYFRDDNEKSAAFHCQNNEYWLDWSHQSQMELNIVGQQVVTLTRSIKNNEHI